MRLHLFSVWVGADVRVFADEAALVDVLEVVVDEVVARGVVTVVVWVVVVAVRTEHRTSVMHTQTNTDWRQLTLS